MTRPPAFFLTPADVSSRSRSSASQAEWPRRARSLPQQGPRSSAPSSTPMPRTWYWPTPTSKTQQRRSRRRHSRRAASSVFPAQRVIVEQPVFERFLETFVAATKELKVGDLQNGATMVNVVATQRVMSMVAEAEAPGRARVLCEGRCSGRSSGCARAVSRIRNCRIRCLLAR